MTEDETSAKSTPILLKIHFPELYKYVVTIGDHDGSGQPIIGSGVLVNIKGRHFVATAQHCIRNNPAILPEGWFSVSGDSLAIG